MSPTGYSYVNTGHCPQESDHSNSILTFVDIHCLYHNTSIFVSTEWDCLRAFLHWPFSLPSSEEQVTWLKTSSLSFFQEREWHQCWVLQLFGCCLLPTLESLIYLQCSGHSQIGPECKHYFLNYIPIFIDVKIFHSSKHSKWHN